MARTPKISTAGKLHSAEKDIWMIIMQKLADAAQMKVEDPRELLRTVTTDALAYYNRIGETQHAAPKVVLFSNLHESSEIDKSVLCGMAQIGAGGTYIFNKVYVDDRELWIERPTHDGIEITKRSLSHEIVHYARDRAGARNHLLATVFSRSMKVAIRTLEEGCAVFVDGVYHAGQGAALQDTVSTIYDDPGIRALSALPYLYEIVSKMDNRLSFRPTGSGFSYRTITKIIDNHPECPEMDRWFYTTGTNIAMVIYAANDFNNEKTVKKLLTLNYDGLLEELRQSVRPHTKEAIDYACNSIKREVRNTR